jgi:hypothetical protein
VHGAGEGNRTPDLLITSEPLCRLSYPGLLVDSDLGINCLRPPRQDLRTRAILPYFPSVAFLRELVDRLARPAHDIRAERLPEWARSVVKWLGRRQLSGIRLGWGLIFEGIIGEGSRKQLQVLTLEYQLLPAPEHG